MTSEDSEEISRYPLHKVTHFRQRFHWDCGVSCVLMLLSPEQRNHFLQNFEQICEEEGFGESTWTIDLCYLLKRFGIKHTMYTTMPGVNEDYKSHSYYRKIIDMDRSRVEQRFKQASANGIDVREHVVTEQQLAEHLRTGPAILLVDAGRLACDLCHHNKLGSQLRGCFGGAFRGHYVVAGGTARSRVLYRDPARWPPPRARPAPTTTACSSTDDTAELLPC